MAALGRAGDQITLSELADHVATDTVRVSGLELATERASDRDAFVDAVGWLATRGAIALADGDASGWAADPQAGEALYDIDRSVVGALFRPPQALQHLQSVRGLLAGVTPNPDDEAPATDAPADIAETRRRVRRALVERPVVYHHDLADAEITTLSRDRTITDVELLTGLSAERRAEGVALIDSSGRLSDVRFPSTGTISQVALLLAGEIAERVLDADAPLPQIELADERASVLADRLDSAIPDGTLFPELATEPESATADATEPTGQAPSYPFVEDSQIADVVDALSADYGKAFAAQWQADRPGLQKAAVSMLDRMRLVQIVPGGLVALPALARYRGVVVTLRARDQDGLFTDNTGTDTDERQ